MSYEAPTVTELGSLSELTAAGVSLGNKNPGSADTVTVGGITGPAPGSGFAP